MYLLVLAIVRNLIYMKNLLTFISNTLNLKLTERSIPLEPQQKPAHLWRQYCLYACLLTEFQSGSSKPCWGGMWCICDNTILIKVSLINDFIKSYPCYYLSLWKNLTPSQDAYMLWFVPFSSSKDCYVIHNFLRFPVFANALALHEHQLASRGITFLLFLFLPSLNAIVWWHAMRTHEFWNNFKSYLNSET